MNAHKEQLQTLGLTIARCREERDISQSQLATMLGYTGHAHLSRIESGKKAPSLYTLFEIADILEIDVRDLFGDL